MAKDPLAEAGLYFDEISGLQILDPDVKQKSLELKEECKVFIEGKYFWALSLYEFTCISLSAKVIQAEA